MCYEMGWTEGGGKEEKIKWLYVFPNKENDYDKLF